MDVKVSITDLTDDEQAGLKLRLDEMNREMASRGTATPLTSMEKVFASSIEVEVKAFADRVREERVAALRGFGEVVVQLPAEVQSDLRRRVIEAAHEHNIDVGSLEEPLTK
jgi:hypothetical protein